MRRIFRSSKADEGAYIDLIAMHESYKS